MAVIALGRRDWNRKLVPHFQEPEMRTKDKNLYPNNTRRQGAFIKYYQQGHKKVQCPSRVRLI